MAQITSREELEEWLKAASHEELEAWLKGKPVDFARVITMRAVLRVLPYAFDQAVSQKWVDDFALGLVRAAMISWIMCIFQDDKVLVGRAWAARAAANADVLPDAPFSVTILAAAGMARALATAIHPSETGVHLAVAGAIEAIAVAAQARATAQLNVDHDSEWLESYTDPDPDPDPASAARWLTREPLWPAVAPEGWAEAWVSATTRLLALDPSYQVWIDWYNRRIEGHDAAFDIPGDIDRTHDKAILARLADASDEDFWGKGATYVNTTLQRWIDEARLTAELESVTRKLEFGAVTQFGSLQARETLATFRAKLDYAVGNQPPAHAPIGHNQPPEGIDPGEAPILPPAIREEAKAVLAMLDQPDRDSALETAKTLTRWSKIKSTYRHDKFSENFSGELGTSMARGIVFILTSLCLLGLAWLKAVLGI
jgi:hypothetical protein